MALAKEEVLSKITREFVLSILAMLPSRNYIVQILRLLYETGGIDVDSFRQMYRGIVDDYVEDVLRAMGVVIENNVVKLKYMSAGWTLVSIYDDLFRIFQDDGFRKKVSEASNVEVPNFLEEWIYVRVNTLLRDPVHGDNARVVLRELTSKRIITVQELISRGLNAGEAYAIADILQSLGLAEHIDGIIRLSPLIGSADILKSALERAARFA